MAYKYRDTQAISIEPVTETGSIVTFENPDDVIGITSLIADIDPIQDGTPWVSPDNTAPYLLRQSPQYGNEYNNEFDTLIGGSIAWNQLTVNGNFNGTTGWRSDANISASNNELHVQHTASWQDVSQTTPIEVIKGHKYLYSVGIKKSSADTPVKVYFNDASNVWGGHSSISTPQDTNWHEAEVVINASVTASTSRPSTDSSSASADYYLRNAMLIDLTATFGTEIADYVYSLEQSTAGSGIAWLKSYGFLTKDYYAYNAGGLVSVKTSEHRTTGKNLYKNEQPSSPTTTQGVTYTRNADGTVSVSGTATGYSHIPLSDFPCKSSMGNITISGLDDANNIVLDAIRPKDANGNVLETIATSAKTITVNLANYPTVASIGIEIKRQTNNVACSGTITPQIEFGSTATAYEPYTAHSYPLDSDLELRGIPKLSNGSLYYDGDEYTADGTVTRKYGIVDLGTLNWSYDSSTPRFLVALSGVKPPSSNNNLGNIITPKYTTTALNVLAYGTIAVSTGGYLSVMDSAYTDAASFKTAMSGVYLVYELATPTTETADSFASPQIVSPLGTEEYVDERDVPVPVGHRTSYRNIAPISGRSEVKIYVSPTTDAEDATVYPVDLNGTRYGKQMNITTGQLEVCPYYASYNGETLTGEWISDRDVYAPGTTPSIGAQVVNIGGTLTTEQLLPTDIKTLVGTNNVWSDSGDITLTYAVDPSLYITLPKEAVSMDGRYLERMIDGYTTLYVKGRESLGIELNNYSVGTADGEKIKGSRYPSRTLTIGFQLLCEDEVEFRAKFNQLNNILSIDEADFIFADEPTMFFTGTPIMDASIEPGRNNVVGEWKLYCAYPFKRSVAPIVHASTDADVVKAGNTATFTFDYAGTRPARPLLRATFASAKSGGDYNEDGDCGYIAFLDSEENIIQLGNPDVIDVDELNKNGTLINSEFDNLTNWTASGISVGSIVDAFWNNGQGQTQNYATGVGTLTRAVTGAIGFEFDIVHRLCVSAPAQTGTFKVSLKNGNNVVVGFIIEKTGSGTLGTVKYILNNKVVGTDSIDLSFYNTNFGYCRRDPVYVTQYYQEKEYYYVKKKGKKKKKKSRWVTRTRTVQSGWSYTQSNLNSGISRDGGIVTFSVGNLADRTFKDSDIDNTSCTSVVFETTGTFHTNAVRSCALVRKAGVPFAEIPNVFTAGDIVEGDCNTANVLLYRAGSAEGHLEPQYGALGNDWEDFTIKPGQNIIRAVWSDWVDENYKPTIEIIFNEVFI